MNLIGSSAIRWLFTVLATVFLVLGFIGIFIPVLPTTPFVLLAASIYARSSPKFYLWITNHHIFGKSLKKWRDQGAISMQSKILAIGMIFVTLGSSILFFVPLMEVKIFLGIFGLSLITFIWTRPN